MNDQPKYIATDATTHQYVVQNQAGHTVYVGHEHPLVVIFERLDRIEQVLNAGQQLRREND